MPILLWEKGYNLGIQQFDDHHRHLVELLNETYDSFNADSMREVTGAVLDKLIDYATYHFAAEEQWMKMNDYAGLAEHIQEHERFTRRVVEIQTDYHNWRGSLTIEILTFLKNWLVDHILKTDAAYAAGSAQVPRTTSGIT